MTSIVVEPDALRAVAVAHRRVGDEVRGRAARIGDVASSLRLDPADLLVSAAGIGARLAAVERGVLDLAERLVSDAGHLARSAERAEAADRPRPSGWSVAIGSPRSSGSFPPPFLGPDPTLPQGPGVDPGPGSGPTPRSSVVPSVRLLGSGDQRLDEVGGALWEGFGRWLPAGLWAAVGVFGPVVPANRRWWNRALVPAAVQGLYRLVDPIRRPSGGGDAGGFGDLPRRPPAGFRVVGSGPAARGRAAVSTLLAHTADASQIRPDEFELVDHGGGAFTLVLPGVTDLSSPGWGLDPVHRSVRDTDVVAARSAASSTPADNRYARMVRDSIRGRVPPGSRLQIIGHSFGADTALDLAADPSFNGGTYRVTHVTAAAYHSGPQLDAVRPGTRVLVLQNHRDLPVLVERLGHLPSGGPGGGADPGSGVPGGEIVVDRFDGGFSLADAGHGQARYLHRLRTVTDPAVVGFLRSVDGEGYTEPGSTYSYDLSVPFPLAGTGSMSELSLPVGVRSPPAPGPAPSTLRPGEVPGPEPPGWERLRELGSIGSFGP